MFCFDKSPVTQAPTTPTTTITVSSDCNMAIDDYDNTSEAAFNKSAIIPIQAKTITTDTINNNNRLSMPLTITANGSNNNEFNKIGRSSTPIPSSTTDATAMSDICFKFNDATDKYNGFIRKVQPQTPSKFKHFKINPINENDTSPTNNVKEEDEEQHQPPKRSKSPCIVSDSFKYNLEKLTMNKSIAAASTKQKNEPKNNNNNDKDRAVFTILQEEFRKLNNDKDNQKMPPPPPPLMPTNLFNSTEYIINQQQLQHEEMKKKSTLAVVATTQSKPTVGFCDIPSTIESVIDDGDLYINDDTGVYNFNTAKKSTKRGGIDDGNLYTNGTGAYIMPKTTRGIDDKNLIASKGRRGGIGEVSDEASPIFKFAENSSFLNVPIICPPIEVEIETEKLQKKILKTPAQIIDDAILSTYGMSIPPISILRNPSQFEINNNNNTKPSEKNNTFAFKGQQSKKINLYDGLGAECNKQKTQFTITPPTPAASSTSSSSSSGLNTFSFGKLFNKNHLQAPPTIVPVKPFYNRKEELPKRKP